MQLHAVELDLDVWTFKCIYFRFVVQGQLKFLQLWIRTSQMFIVENHLFSLMHFWVGNRLNVAWTLDRVNVKIWENIVCSILQTTGKSSEVKASMLHTQQLAKKLWRYTVLFPYKIETSDNECTILLIYVQFGEVGVVVDKNTTVQR